MQLSKQTQSKRVDAVGIEPTTFHMCEDAKRLKPLLVRSSEENRSRTVEAYKSYPLRKLLVESSEADWIVVITY